MAWTDSAYKLHSEASIPKEEYLQYPKADFGTRSVAYLIDGILLLPTIFIPILVGLFIVIGYWMYFEGGKGATPGKMIMNLKVVTIDGKIPIGYSRAFVRCIGKLISIIVIFLGVIWIAIDRDKQGWHDKIANTYVVKVGKEPWRLVEEEVRPKRVNILIKIIKENKLLSVSMFCAIVLVVLMLVVGEILIHIVAVIAYSLILSYYFFKIVQEGTKKS